MYGHTASGKTHTMLGGVQQSGFLYLYQLKAFLITLIVYVHAVCMILYCTRTCTCNSIDGISLCLSLTFLHVLNKASRKRVPYSFILP